MTVADPIQFIAETDATDAALLAAVARGDATGLATLANRYGGFIRAAALRQTGDPATADDVTQAVLIVLSKKAAHIAARALPAWLHQTTRYAAANANRAARRRRVHERRAARPEGQMDPTPDEINPLLGLLDEAIARLGEPDRRAVVGRFLLGQDAATVAAGLGVSTRAAQKRIERAVERLRERLIAAQRSATGSPALAMATATASDATLSASSGVGPSNAGSLDTASADAVSTGSIAAGSHSPAAGGRVSLKAIAITPAVVAAVLTAAAPSPASAAVVIAVPTVAAATLAKQTATWMTIAKVKAAVLAVVPAAVLTGAVGTAAVVTLAPATKQAAPTVPAVRPVPPVAQVTQQNFPFVAQPTRTRATLRSGAWVEYVALRDTKTANSTWFGIDGQPMVPGPFPATEGGFGTTGGDERVQRQFAFKLSSPLLMITANAEGGRLALDWHRSTPLGAFSDYLRYPDSAPAMAMLIDRFGVSYLAKPNEPTTAVFKIAAGPWVPRVVSQANADVNIVATNDVRVAGFSVPFEDTGEATIWVRPPAFYSQPDTRIVAIDIDGRTHVTTQWSTWYRSPQERADEPLYDRQVPRLRFDKVPFGDVVKRFEAMNIPMAIKWDELDQRHHVTPQTPVSGTVGPGRLSDALGMLFQWVGDGGEPQFDVKDGVVVVRAFDTENQKPWPCHVPGVPLARLDHFEVQTRNYDQWIAFENLSAELGKPANPVIRTSDDPPDANATAATANPTVNAGANATAGGASVTLANGSRVTLVAIGDAKTGEAWRPDGTPCAVPFGYRPQEDYPVAAGKRRIWAMTVTRDSAGQSVLARSYLLNGAGTEQASGGFSAMNRPATDGVIYQARELVIDANLQTTDWAVAVASKPPTKTSIERGPDGWPADVLGTLKIGNGEAAYVWGPHSVAVTPRSQFDSLGRTNWQVWTPPSIGKRDEIRMDYVTRTGDSPNGSMFGYADSGGFHTAQCQETLENLQRVTMSLTRYDLAAMFGNVSLYPGKKATVTTSAQQLEKQPGR